MSNKKLGIKIKVETSKQEYSNLTFDEVCRVAQLRNEGKTESEALEIVFNERGDV